MSPKEKAKSLFNSIRYMDNESGKDCITCDCIVLPIAKFICNEIADECKKSNAKDYSERVNYWVTVKAELERL